MIHAEKRLAHRLLTLLLRMTPLTLNSDLKRLFTWLTRNGIGPKFGTRPIGWYQIHQCKALDYLGELVLSFPKGKDTPLRVKFGNVQAQGHNGRWCTLCSTIQAFQEADNQARR